MKETFGLWSVEPAESRIKYVEFHNCGRFWV